MLPLLRDDQLTDLLGPLLQLSPCNSWYSHEVVRRQVTGKGLANHVRGINMVPIVTIVALRAAGGIGIYQGSSRTTGTKVIVFVDKS